MFLVRLAGGTIVCYTGSAHKNKIQFSGKFLSLLFPGLPYMKVD
jgi:hypothetical protein